jgi:hypothetical protein
LLIEAKLSKVGVEFVEANELQVEVALPSGVALVVGQVPF